MKQGLPMLRRMPLPTRPALLPTKPLLRQTSTRTNWCCCRKRPA
jgi:hypothetical protein